MAGAVSIKRIQRSLVIALPHIRESADGDPARSDAASQMLAENEAGTRIR
jgi:hypothetical protein